MIHLLIISGKHLPPPFGQDVDTATDVKVVYQSDPKHAGPLIETRIFDVVLLHAASAREAIDLVENLPAFPSQCKLAMAAPEWSTDEQSQAYNVGATATLNTPLSVEILTNLADGNQTKSLSEQESVQLADTELVIASSNIIDPSTNAESLELLRDFSRLLGYSLDPTQFAQQFVQRLREILSANRIAVFFESPPNSLDHHDGNQLHCGASVGIPRDVLRCLELSRRSGLGKHITQNGQVLKKNSETRNPHGISDPRIDREFDILGCQVALPINDRENTIGLAVIGGRLTGGNFHDNELKLVYHLLEELGIAVRNSWMHHAVASSEHTLGQILGAIDSGCLMVEADMRIRQANRSFLKFIRGSDIDFDTPVDKSELPDQLAQALEETVKDGRLHEPFMLPSPAAPGRTYQVKVVSLSETTGELPQPVIAVVDDFTQVLSAQRAEIEASNLRLTTLIAKRFAHEIRNSLVPLNTHEQLFETEYDQPDFRASLKSALTRETSRIQRFTDQMLLLSHPSTEHLESLDLAHLLKTAFRGAEQAYGRTGTLEIDQTLAKCAVRVQQLSMMHALEEIFLNSLQSSDSGVVTVSRTRTPASQDASQIELLIRDSGDGFDKEQAERATEAFFTTRNTGVGLGLTVARRVFESHGGQLRIFARQTTPDSADLVIQLPLR